MINSLKNKEELINESLKNYLERVARLLRREEVQRRDRNQMSKKTERKTI